MTAPRYLTAKDIAAELQCSLRHAYALMPQMRCLRAGKLLRVSRTEFDRWCREHEEGGPAAVARPSSTRPARAPVVAPLVAVSSTRGPLKHTQPGTKPRPKPDAQALEAGDLPPLKHTQPGTRRRER